MHISSLCADWRQAVFVELVYRITGVQSNNSAHSSIALNTKNRRINRRYWGIRIVFELGEESAC